MAYEDIINHDWTSSTEGSMSVSASSNYAGAEPWEVFNGHLGSFQFWLTASTVAGWLKLDLGLGNTETITRVGIQVNNLSELNRAPKDFTVQGSNDDSAWTTLETVTGEVSWGNAEKRDFVLTTTGAYRYYKIDITDNNGDARSQIGELFLYKTVTQGAEYEDLTTYTEIDPNNNIIVESGKVWWSDLATRNVVAGLYKDKGATFFSGDFTHKLEMADEEVGNVQHTIHWALTNSVNDYYGVIGASEDGYFLFNYDTALNIYIRTIENGGVGSDDFWTDNVAGTIYFIEIVRDDDGGANNTGRLTAYIRIGSHSGALQDTLVVDCSAGEQNDFRYIYALSTADDGDTVTVCRGLTQNFSIKETEDLGANDVSSSTQITVPLLTVGRQLSAPNIESLSQITAAIVEKGWLYPSDILCSTQVTVPAFTVKHSLSIPNIECLSQVTAPSTSVNHLGANDVPCNTEITVPAFTVKRPLAIPNIESSSEVGASLLEKLTPLNPPDISCLTEVTAVSIYKELFPLDIESSSEVEAADLEWIKILKLNATLPMITAEMSGGHGGFLNVELPMITAEMRAGAQLNVTLPMITAELEGRVGVKADLNVTLPMITAAIRGTVEVLGQLNAALPIITARMTGTAGHVGQLNVTLPMITAALTGYTDIDGQLNVTLPMIEARLTGTNDRFATCDPLRYTEPELE